MKLTSKNVIYICSPSFLKRFSLAASLKQRTRGRSLHLVPTESLGGKFPKRLMELHSHWRDETCHAVQFRPVHFREKSIHFLWLYVYVPQGRGAASGACLRIPEHLRTKSPEELMRYCDVEHQLVCQKAKVMDIIHKFEDKAFIHQYVRWRGEQWPRRPSVVKLQYAKSG